RNCKCCQCLWYEPDYDYGYERLSSGKCTYPRKKYVSNNIFSNKKVKNVIEVTSKAVYGQIEGLTTLYWIPNSVINSEGFIKEWFVK
ncbi:unnamed protein product, partial [marine sediment metagenome]